MGWIFRPALCWLGLLALGAVVVETFGPRETSSSEQATVNLSCEVPDLEVPPGVEVLTDLEYGQTPERVLTLDLYRPLHVDQPLPVILWIHGGGWRSGSKSSPSAMDLVPRGFAVASIEFRSSAEAIFPAQLDDCRESIRWLRAHADEYQLDGARIGVWGISSGGHLAALLGVMNDPETRVQAVVDFYGPVDFTRMDKQSDENALIRHAGAQSPESLLVGGAIAERKDLVRQASPLSYIEPGAIYPPFMIVHGFYDHIVPWQQSRLLSRALKDVGASVHFVPSSDVPHSDRLTPKLIDGVGDFFVRELIEAPTAPPQRSPIDHRQRLKHLRRSLTESGRALPLTNPQV